MSRSPIVFTIITILLLTGVSVEGKGKGVVKTVYVDCEKGQSISAALETEAEELIVEIRGTCYENVAVWRSNVTLRGEDPDVDVIHGVTDPHPGGTIPLGAVVATLELHYAHNVVLENLTLENGSIYGLGMWESNAESYNCRFVDNPDFGAHFSSGSYLRAFDSTFRDNGAGGARVQRTAVFLCERCTFIDNPSSERGTAAAATNGGLLYLIDSDLSAENGVTVGRGSLARLVNSSIEARQALGVWYLSQLELFDVTFSGGFSIHNKSRLIFYRACQTANPRGWNSIESDSSVSVGDSDAPSTIAGTTGVDRFSQLAIEADSMLNGDLTCSSGGDAYCVDPSKITGSVTGCGLCVKP